MNLDIQTVATRQLESAIWMYAYDFDEICVHTVACTAFEILLFRLKQGVFTSNLNKKQKTLLKSKHFTENNFFKHGQINYDNIDVLEFDPKVTEDVLMFACEANVRGPESHRLQCAYLYLLHYSFKNSNVFSKEYIDKILGLIEAIKVIGSLEDKKTLVKMLNLIKNWKIPSGVKV